MDTTIIDRLFDVFKHPDNSDFNYEESYSAYLTILLTYKPEEIQEVFKASFINMRINKVLGGNNVGLSLSDRPDVFGILSTNKRDIIIIMNTGEVVPVKDGVEDFLINDLTNAYHKALEEYRPLEFSLDAFNIHLLEPMTVSKMSMASIQTRSSYLALKANEDKDSLTSALQSLFYELLVSEYDRAISVFKLAFTYSALTDIMEEEGFRFVGCNGVAYRFLVNDVLYRVDVLSNNTLAFLPICNSDVTIPDSVKDLENLLNKHIQER